MGAGRKRGGSGAEAGRKWNGEMRSRLPEGAAGGSTRPGGEDQNGDGAATNGPVRDIGVSKLFTVPLAPVDKL